MTGNFQILGARFILENVLREIDLNDVNKIVTKYTDCTIVLDKNYIEPTVQFDEQCGPSVGKLTLFKINQ